MTTENIALKCDRCHQRLVITPEETEYFGPPCDCGGTYHIAPTQIAPDTCQKCGRLRMDDGGVTDEQFEDWDIILCDHCNWWFREPKREPKVILPNPEHAHCPSCGRMYPVERRDDDEMLRLHCPCGKAYHYPRSRYDFLEGHGCVAAFDRSGALSVDRHRITYVPASLQDREPVGLELCSALWSIKDHLEPGDNVALYVGPTDAGYEWYLYRAVYQCGSTNLFPDWEVEYVWPIC